MLESSNNRSGVFPIISPNNLIQLPRIIGQGIGQVFVSFELNPKSKTYKEHLYDIQQIIIQPFDINGILFTPDTITKPFGIYDGLITSGNHLRIYTTSRWSKRRRYSVMLCLYGRYCEGKSYQDILQLIDNIKNYLSLTTPTLNRLDYFLDIINFYHSWENLKRFHSLIAPVENYPPNQNVPLQGTTWGDSKKVQLNVYNKTIKQQADGRDIRELYPYLSSNTEVWRAEGRWKRPWLKKRGYTTPSHVLPGASAILGKFLKHTIWVKGRNGKKAKFWLEWIDQLMSGNPLPPPQATEGLPFDEVIGAKTLCGYGARYAVGVGLDSLMDAFTRALSVYNGSGGDEQKLLSQKLKQTYGKGAK